MQDTQIHTGQKTNYVDEYRIIYAVIRDVGGQDGGEVGKGMYFGNPSATDYMMSFGRYGIPRGWSVIGISSDDVTRHRAGQVVAKNVREILNLPLLDRGGHRASWKQDFQLYFNLDRNFEPIGDD